MNRPSSTFANVAAVLAVILLRSLALGIEIGVCCNNTYTWLPGNSAGPCRAPAMSVCDLGAPVAPKDKPGNKNSGSRDTVCVNYAQQNPDNWYLGPCTDPPSGQGWIKIPGDDGKNPPSCCWVRNPTITSTPTGGTVATCDGLPCIGT